MTWQAAYAERFRAVSIERPPAPPKPMTDAEFEALVVEIEKTNPLGAAGLRAGRQLGHSMASLAQVLLNGMGRSAEWRAEVERDA